MLVTLLQMMGFPLGMPVHSRAEGPGGPVPSAGNAAPLSQTPSVSVRRRKVNAKTTSATPPKAGTATKTGAKASKPTPAPVKTVAATKKASPATKPAPAPAVAQQHSGKTTHTTAPAAKAPAVVKTARTDKAAPAKKPTAKTPTAKTPTAKTPAVKPLPKATPAKTAPVVAETKVKPSVNVIASKPSAPAPATAVSGVPVKSGRPSSRLAQLTVPSMAQSVASTAAKSSFNQAAQAPAAAPVIPAIVKKDAKLANNWKTTPVDRLTDAELLAMPDSEYMNEVQMAAFKLKLSNLKRDILSNAGETTEHQREDTCILQRACIAAQLVRFLGLGGTHLVGAELVNGLRRQTQVPHNGNAHIDDATHRGADGLTTFDFDGFYAGLLDHAAGIAQSLVGVHLVAHERQVTYDQSTLCSRSDQASVIEHLLHRDRDGCLATLHNHGDRITDQQHVETCFIQQSRHRVVVRGQRGDGLATLFHALQLRGGDLALLSRLAGCSAVVHCAQKIPSQRDARSRRPCAVTVRGLARATRLQPARHPTQHS